MPKTQENLPHPDEHRLAEEKKLRETIAFSSPKELMQRLSMDPFLQQQLALSNPTLATQVAQAKRLEEEKKKAEEARQKKIDFALLLAFMRSLENGQGNQAVPLTAAMALVLVSELLLSVMFQRLASSLLLNNLPAISCNPFFLFPAPAVSDHADRPEFYVPILKV